MTELHAKPKRKRNTPFRVLQYKVAEAHWRWKVWKQIFIVDSAGLEDKEARKKLLTQTAPNFFSMLHGLLLGDVVLRICKLTDPKESKTRKSFRTNLTLKAARHNVDKRLSIRKKNEADKLLSELEILIEPMKKWRNWQIAHEDQRTALGQEVLPKIPFADIDKTLQIVVSVMLLLDRDYAKLAYRYDEMVAAGDGESLLRALRWAQHYRADCIERGQRPRS